MSKSLFRKAFDFCNDLDKNTASDKIERSKSDYTNKKGNKKNKLLLQREKRSKQVNRVKASTKDKRIKNAVDEYKKKKKKDMTEANIALLKELSKTKIPSKEATLIFKHNRGRLAMNNVEMEEESVPEETAFTDTDFEEFDKAFHLP